MGFSTQFLIRRGFGHNKFGHGQFGRGGNFIAMYLTGNSVTACGFTITFSGKCWIDWGDGTVDELTSGVEKTHTYASAFTGTAVIKRSSGGVVSIIAQKNTGNGFNFNISALPRNLTGAVFYVGIVSGNIADAPGGLTNLYLFGSNTLSGNIADAPGGLTNLYVAGSNTLSGNIADAPGGLTNLAVFGSNTLSDYAAGRVWANNMRQLYLRQATGYGLNTSEVDNLLIDLSNVSTWSTEKVVNIAGNNASRSSASDSAVLTLQGKGVTVTTN